MASVRGVKRSGEYRTPVVAEPFVIWFAVTMKHGGCGFESAADFEGFDSDYGAGRVGSGRVEAGGGFRCGNCATAAGYRRGTVDA